MARAAPVAAEDRAAREVAEPRERTRVKDPEATEVAEAQADRVDAGVEVQAGRAWAFGASMRLAVRSTPSSSISDPEARAGRRAAIRASAVPLPTSSTFRCAEGRRAEGAACEGLACSSGTFIES